MYYVYVPVPWNEYKRYVLQTYSNTSEKKAWVLVANHLNTISNYLLLSLWMWTRTLNCLNHISTSVTDKWKLLSHGIALMNKSYGIKCFQYSKFPINFISCSCPYRVSFLLWSLSLIHLILSHIYNFLSYI